MLGLLIIRTFLLGVNILVRGPSQYVKGRRLTSLPSAVTPQTRYREGVLVNFSEDNCTYYCFITSTYELPR